MTNPRYVSFNGEVTRWEDARVHVQTPLVRYGAGVFEGIAGYWNEGHQQLYIFRLKEHLARLALSMKIMRFSEAPDANEMESALFAVLEANKMREDVHIRLLTWIDGAGDMTSTGPYGWSIVALPRHRSPKQATGLHACVASWRRIDEGSMPPRLKSVANYNQGRLAWTQANLDGYDAVLLLNAQGHVTETPMSCLFMVRNGIPATPLATDNILESITRDTVLELLSEQAVTERHIDRSELYISEEVFLCGSGQEITPVISVDRHMVGDGRPGPITQELLSRYFAIARGDTNLRPEWRTAVL